MALRVREFAGSNVFLGPIFDFISAFWFKTQEGTAAATTTTTTTTTTTPPTTTTTTT